MLTKSEKIKFSILQASYWCSFASFNSFVIAYVRTKGISATYIGIMGAAFMLCAVTGQFFWGGICDRFQSNKKVFILTNLLVVFVSYILFLTDSPAVILITYAALGFTLSPTASNLDAWILKNSNNNFDQYGPIRSMGSFGFAVFIVFYGIFISSKGYWIMPISLTLFIAVSIGVSLKLPEAAAVSATGRAKLSLSDFKALFSIRAYLFLLVILFFIGYSITAMLQNKILIWEYFGAPISYQGFDSSVSALFQVPLLLLTASLSKINVRLRLTAGIFLNFIMLLIVYHAKIPQMVVVADMINGAGYGLVLPSMREIIAKLTPAKLSTTAQGLGDAVYSSLSGIIASLISGVVIDSYGIKTMIFINVVVFLFPLFLSVVNLIFPREGYTK